MMSSAGGVEVNTTANTVSGDIEMTNSDAANTAATSNPSSTTAFPLARVKKIIKADKDVNLVSAEAVHLTSVATELFLEFLVKKATEVSLADKRRTILYKDFATVVKQDQRMSFLQELIPEMVSVQAALEAQRSRSLTANLASATPQTASPTSTPSKQTSSDSINSESIAAAPKNNRTIADFFAKQPAAEVDIEDMQ